MRLTRVAIRVLNEYRRLSPLSYLALRYYLRASATTRSRWAEEIAPEVLLRQDEPPYWTCHRYKESDTRGGITFRTLRCPGANYALAEGALLLQCARAGGAFNSAPDVFSYQLAPPDSSEGCFVRYFKRYTARQVAIGEACDKWPDYYVLYADIKSFYPSVALDRATKVWQRACAESKLEKSWQALGERLIQHYQKADGGLAIGPMFSHLLANLFLRNVDKKLRKRFPGRYFRYVDDITLLIPESEKGEALKAIQAELCRLSLKLNTKKTLCLPAAEWRRTAPCQRVDYERVEDRDDERWWMHCIDRLKCFLMAHPEERDALSQDFDDKGIRLALPRFHADTQEYEYQDRFRKRLRSKSFQSYIKTLSRPQVVELAQKLGDLYYCDYEDAWQEFCATQGVQRKWAQSKLRSVLGRLVHMARPDQLASLARQLAGSHEFAEYRAVFAALASRDVSEVLSFGGSICTIVGQALATSGEPVRCKPRRWNENVVEGYMLLMLLGANLRPHAPERVTRRYGLRVITGECKAGDWARVKNSFFRELACLAAGSSLTEHREMLQSPVDPDESWVLYADDLREMSS